MWMLIGAVVTASLLGSMHCVGMCGPLAMWASGAGDRDGRGRMSFNVSLYHAGRLLTYALVGLIAGFVGELADFGGEVLGVQLVAARVVGLAMIVLGALQLLRWSGWTAGGYLLPKTQTKVGAKPALITIWLVSLRPFVFSLNLSTRAFVTGLLTAFLPCGWLYLFALVAAGTGSWVAGPAVMIAFWVGTVPALIGIVLSIKLLGGGLRRFIPVAVALMMIFAGGFAMAGRGFAKLHSLAEISLPVHAMDSESTQCEPKSVQLLQSLDELVKTPLPCCQLKPD